MHRPGKVCEHVAHDRCSRRDLEYRCHQRDRQKASPAQHLDDQYRERATQPTIEPGREGHAAQRENLPQCVPGPQRSFVHAKAQCEPERQQLHRHTQAEAKHAKRQRVAGDDSE